MQPVICGGGGNPATQYNNIGWTYHDAGEHAQALATFQKATAARRAEGDPALIRIAVWAEALQQELLRGFDDVGEQDGYVYEEIAECLTALGRDDEARSYFAAPTRRFHAIPGWRNPSLRGWSA